MFEMTSSLPKAMTNWEGFWSHSQFSWERAARQTSYVKAKICNAFWKDLRVEKWRRNTGGSKYHDWCVQLFFSNTTMIHPSSHCFATLRQHHSRSAAWCFGSQHSLSLIASMNHSQSSAISHIICLFSFDGYNTINHQQWRKTTYCQQVMMNNCPRNGSWENLQKTRVNGG